MADKPKTIVEILNSKGITPNTKHHNYDYLYNAVVESCNEWGKRMEDWEHYLDEFSKSLGLSDTPLSFHLTKEQYQIFLDWKKDLPELKHKLSVGDYYTFIFIPSGIGTCINVRRVDGHEINLNENDNP